MNAKQKIALFAPLILACEMYFIFQFLAGVFLENWRIGWYLGLLVYWLVWGAVFPLWLVGKNGIIALIHPQKLNRNILLLIAIPLVLAATYRLVPGMGYQKTNVWTLCLILSTTFFNGFFEELFWRGVYLKLFPKSTLFRFVWPNVCFAFWHYVPGSVSPGKNIIGLMIGSGLFGFYLAYLAKKTNTLWWSMITHTIGGIIIVG